MSSTVIGESSQIRPGIRTRWLALVAMFGLALMGAGGYRWWVEWCQNRWAENYRDRAYRNVASRFLTDVKQGRFDDAYEATSSAFQQRLNREEFAERARACAEFHAKPGARRVAANQNANVDRGYRTKQVVTVTDILQDAEGNRLDVSTTVVIVDSIFYRHPPTPLVDDFSVTRLPVASEQQ